MQLFIDIDGVLLDFERSFVSWLNREHAMGLPPDYQADSWDFTEIMTPAELDARWRRYLASAESERMPPIIEPERFNALGDAHDVHLVTNFPRLHWDKRVRNLAELGLRYDSLNHCGLIVFDGHRPKSKAQIVAELRAHPDPALFLDDHPDNCLDVLHHCPGVEVWLMTRRFNRTFDHPDVRRADGWSQLLLRLEVNP